MKNYDFYQGRKDYVHGSSSTLGVLLTNLGTPDEPTPAALRRYLKQFLSDVRVIELPKLKWQFILNAFVLPFRPKKVSHDYASIWTDEGSPLLVITRSQAKNLEQRLSQVVGSPLAIEVGMRYGNPSIESALQKLRDRGADRILVLPMYGQYSSATSGSTFDCLADELKRWRWIPSLRTIMQFHDHPLYIDCLVRSIRDFWEKNGRSEKLLMSFHGIPERYHLNGDPYPCHCYKTARLVAEQLQLRDDEYLVSFQSLFGKEEWVKPYTDKTLESLAKGGLSSIDVICPGFLADCLETIEEIEVENRDNFIDAGGSQYRYIPALNDREDFMDALCHIVLENIGGWYQPVHDWNSEQKQLECQASLESYNKVKANS